MASILKVISETGYLCKIKTNGTQSVSIITLDQEQE